jgi:arylsulfatase
MNLLGMSVMGADDTLPAMAGLPGVRTAARSALACLVAALLGLLALRAANAAPRPNFVVILADDMGYSDIGSYGGEIATPNLDALAAAGLRFTQFYNTARCSPTRAALLTGVHPHEAGMGFLPNDWQPPGYTGSLAEDVVTIPEALSGAGYRSYLAGKWHLSDQMVEQEGDEARISKASWPLARGFDRFYGTITGAGNFFFPITLVEDERPISAEGEGYYYTDAISDRAADFVREHSAQPARRPFFLYVAYTAPHWPLHAREPDVARYRGRYEAGWDALRAERHARMLELGVVERRWPLSPRDPDAPAWEEAEHRAWQVRRMEVYAAQIEVMDRGIGRIVDALRDTGALHDTLLIFLSDNGGCAEELWDAPAWVRQHLPLAFRSPARDGRPVQRGNDPAHMPGGEHTFQSYGLAWANASNTPFRLYKQQVHEGGIATPLIAHWPAGLATAPGALSRAPGHVVDLMPTLLELAGVTPPQERAGRPSRKLRGESLVRILRGGTRERGTLFWEHQGNRAIRQGRWKLVSRWRGGWELYDLEADRTELTDLAAEQPERVSALEALYEDWAAEAGVEPWPWVVRPLRRGVALLGLIGLATAALLFTILRKRAHRT